MPNPSYSPTYSHGGAGGNDGKVVGSGKWIDVAASDKEAVIYVACDYQTAVDPGSLPAEPLGYAAIVAIEASGGPINPLTNEPIDADAIDVTNGGLMMNRGERLAKVVTPTMPYWRTRVVYLAPGFMVRSYVPYVRAMDGMPVSAGYVSVVSNATQGQ